MHVHKARFGVDCGGSKARQKRVFELGRDAAARGYKGGEFGVSLIASLEHIGHGMGDIINAGACQSLLLQQADGFVQLAARVFEVRGWAAHGGDEALEQVRDAFPRPGHCH